MQNNLVGWHVEQDILKKHNTLQSNIQTIQIFNFNISVYKIAYGYSSRKNSSARILRSLAFIIYR
jgi:hypothetical protein